MDGIMNIYKEPGYTSFDVVAKLRGILKQKKIGHTGTLDPDAEGVLVVCLGNATKLSEMLTDKDKEYTAVLRLGVTTDTEDMSGRVLRQLPVDCEEQAVRAAVESFRGIYQQIPPMYSAIKKNGKKLYELAHAGIEIDREPRRVEIYEIEVISTLLPLVRFRVRCSKGTYIRSLCRDIGERLSCGGCMEHLLRNRVSSFTAETALTLSAVERLKDADRLSEAVSPIDSLFPSYRKLAVHKGAEKYLYNGNPLTTESFSILPDALTGNELVFIYDTKGELKGLYRYLEAEGILRPYKMFLN